ncbi:MAG: DUF1735 domain-containing protein [Williamsia sp.]|nr:DUF1735 domain-containing protein [Williamsia sp.]
MKTTYFFALLLLLGASYTSCRKAAAYEDAIYFTGTEQVPETKFTIDGPSSIGLTVSSSNKVEKDVAVNIKIDSSLVSSYNKARGTAYQFLPAGSYELPQSSMVLRQGTSVSEQAKFSVLSLAEFKDGVIYCVPVSITGAGNAKVLESSRTVYLIINRTIITQAVTLSPNYFTVPGFLTAISVASVPRLSMECRIFVNQFQTANPFISSIMGIEENFLLRLGDVSIANNQLQLAGGVINGKSHPVSSKAFFATGQWYHVAVVYNNSTISLYVNGVLDNYTDAGSGGVDLTGSYSGGFHIGFSAGGRLLNGYVSEARVWTKALSASELQNNLCIVDPTAKDLLAYWRFNAADASGNVTDLTGHGYTAVAARAPVWVPGVRCPK